MRHVLFVALGMSAGLSLSPALADEIGLPTRTFVQSWTALPTGHFTPEGLNGSFRLVRTRAKPLSDTEIAPLLDGALASAGDDALRRGVALSEMAASWDQDKRSAFQRLRDAEAAYAGSNDPRNRRFVATLSRLTNGVGRSAATDGSAASAAVDSAYAGALSRSAGSDRVAAEATQEAWRDYRDAFAAFADLQQPGSADGVTAELDRQRASDLAKPVH